MERQSKADEHKWQDLQVGLEARDAIALEVMREVFARLQFGESFTLSDGSVARLEKLSEPELCQNEQSENFERACVSFDVAITGGVLDHVEITAFQTGWGMAINQAAITEALDKKRSREPERGA